MPDGAEERRRSAAANAHPRGRSSAAASDTKEKANGHKAHDASV